MTLSIGIDLGTTNSVAAIATPTGVQFVVGDAGERIHPSVVAFPHQGGILVGRDAALQRAVDAENTIYSAKRLIGQNIRAPLVQLALTSLPFQVEEGPNQQPIIVAQGRRVTVPEISAQVLIYLKELTERQFGDDVTEAVITVPANFSDAQRQATKEAGRLADMEVLRLVNEPTAAALAYGFGQSLDQVVAVFDYGGGTFDISLLKISSDIFEVLATDGDFFLGGDDVDRALSEYLAAEMTRTQGVDPRPHRAAMTRLMMASEQIKCHLSMEQVAEGTIDGLVIEDYREPQSVPFRITRHQFDNLIVGYVDRTIDVCRNVMVSSGLDYRQLSEVICVGGSTRIPLVRQRIAELFGREPSIGINPDEVVAHGAAIQAGTLSGKYVRPQLNQPAAPPGVSLAAPGADFRDLGGAPRSSPALPLPAPAPEPVAARPLLMDVTPASMRIATAGGYSEVLLEKNAPIPIERTKLFTTAHNDQTRVVVECARGESKEFTGNELLGSLVLDGLPPGPRGQTRIEVTFRVDTDGILHVRARDKKTGQAQEATLNVIGAPVQEESEHRSMLSEMFALDEATDVEQ